VVCIHCESNNVSQCLIILYALHFSFNVEAVHAATNVRSHGSVCVRKGAKISLPSEVGYLNMTRPQHGPVVAAADSSLSLSFTPNCTAIICSRRRSVQNVETAWRSVCMFCRIVDLWRSSNHLAAVLRRISLWMDTTWGNWTVVHTLSSSKFQPWTLLEQSRISNPEAPGGQRAIRHPNTTV
jgi:hypothetical protein